MQSRENITGYPSIDKPWLKYYSEDVLKKPLPNCTVYDLLWQSNKDCLKNIALSYFGNEISFHKLFKNIEKAVKGFSAMGVKDGDIVVMVTVTTPETVYAIYALNRLGAISNMIDPRTSAEGIKEYINEVNAQYLLVLDTVYDKIERIISDTSIKHTIIVSPADSLSNIKKAVFKMANRRTSLCGHVGLCKRWNEFIHEGKDTVIDMPVYRKNKCCLILHTGGTTGIPKGVMLSNENINALVIQSIDTGIDMQRTHTWLDIMPPFIAYGFGMGLHLPLVIGMKTILIPQFDPLKFDELLLKYKPIHMVGVPSYWGTIINSKKLKNSDMSYLIAPTVGGDTMNVSLEEAANCFLREHGCTYKITKGYGMTEVCAGVAGTVDGNNEIGSVGIPFSKTLISIFEPDSEKELTYNQMGEVCIAGPNVMLGYYNNKEATSQIIKVHKDGQAWLHSGDLGYMNENGSLFIVDRIKKIIIRYDGFKVFPVLVDKVVLSHKAIMQSCTVGINDEVHAQGKLPYVYAVLQEEYKKFEDEVRTQIIDYCQKELPEYMQPVEIEFLNELPLTPIGKVDYRKLEKMASDT